MFDFIRNWAFKRQIKKLLAEADEMEKGFFGKTITEIMAEREKESRGELEA